MLITRYRLCFHISASLCFFIFYAVPSAPANPRIYVLHSNTHEGEEKVLVELRWDKPERDNGVLTQFRVYYQLLYESGAADTLMEWNVSDVKPTALLFSIRDVHPRLTVRFQVWKNYWPYLRCYQCILMYLSRKWCKAWCKNSWHLLLKLLLHCLTPRQLA